MFAGTPEALRPGRGLSRLGLEAALSGHVMGGRQSGVGRCGHPSLEPGSVGGGPCFPLILPLCGQNLNPKKPRAPQLNQGRRVLSGILSPLASRSR